MYFSRVYFKNIPILFYYCRVVFVNDDIFKRLKYPQFSNDFSLENVRNYISSQTYFRQNVTYFNNSDPNQRSQTTTTPPDFLPSVFFLIVSHGSPEHHRSSRRIIGSIGVLILLLLLLLLGHVSAGALRGGEEQRQCAFAV